MRARSSFAVLALAALLAFSAAGGLAAEEAAADLDGKAAVLLADAPDGDAARFAQALALAFEREAEAAGISIAAKAAVGLEGNTVFLAVGRLGPQKRMRELVELWAELLSEERVKPGIRLVIVGKGPEEKKLKEAVAQLEVGQSVTLAGPKDDLLPYYRAADVFVLFSLTGGMSNSMLEAMACGVAVMAARGGGAGDAVTEGESGCLFDPLNPGEIKQCLRRFIADRNLALRLGEKARATAVEKYSMARVADEIMKIYEE